jgi:hypothetical protein
MILATERAYRSAHLSGKYFCSLAIMPADSEYTMAELPYSYMDLVSFSFRDIPSPVIRPMYSETLTVFLLVQSYLDVER